MRYLLLSSCLLLLFSCAGVHKNLQTETGDVHLIQKFKPSFTVALYKTEVNVTGKYLSGLLMMKQMPDSSLRMDCASGFGAAAFITGTFGFVAAAEVVRILVEEGSKP